MKKWIAAGVASLVFGYGALEVFKNKASEDTKRLVQDNVEILLAMTPVAAPLWAVVIFLNAKPPARKAFQTPRYAPKP